MAAKVMEAVEKTAKWVPAPKTPEPRSSLTIHLEGGEEVGWTAVPGKRGDGCWNKFLKWYHGRPKSRSFVMDYKEGSHMVRRKDIKRYEIRYWEA